MEFRPLNVVFDTNIFIQVLLNPKSIASQCFDFARTGQISLFVSKMTLVEVRDVVFRPHILSLLPDADLDQLDSFLEDILSLSTLIKSVQKRFRFERDPKDEMIIDLAIACEADYIVSRDKDMLDLILDLMMKAKSSDSVFGI